MAFRILSDQTQERETEASVDQQGRVTRTHTEKFRCESDEPMSDYQAGIELNYQPGQPHPEDPLTPLKSVKIKQLTHRNPWRFDVTVVYSNNVPDSDEIEDDNPLNSPAKVRWEGGDMEIAITKDRDGNPILLPNRRPFNPPVTKLLASGRLTINRNERVLDIDPDDDYKLHVNENRLAGKAPGTMLLLSITSERETKNGIVFYPHEFVWVYNKNGWNEEILSQDTHELIDDQWKPILDDRTREPITEPVPIGPNGQKIPAGELPALAHFQTINKYPESSFAGLRLPV